MAGSRMVDPCVLGQLGLEYTDCPHFSRQYRRVLGESPKATRERGRQAREPLPS